MKIRRQKSIADQIKLMLHSRIQEGYYIPGVRMPSEQELAKEFRVSRATVRIALTALASLGLVVRKQGDGTYINDHKNGKNSLMTAIWEFGSLVKASGREPSITPISVQKRTAKKDEENALEIQTNEEVISVERLFYANEKPIILSVNISPLKIFNEDIDDLDATLGIHEFLSRYCNNEIASVDVKISPIMPSESVREVLALDSNTPLLLIEEIFSDISHVPLVFARNYFYCDEKLSLIDIRPWYSR